MRTGSADRARPASSVRETALRGEREDPGSCDERTRLTNGLEGTAQLQLGGTDQRRLERGDAKG